MFDQSDFARYSAAYCLPLAGGNGTARSNLLYRHSTVSLALDTEAKCYGCHFLFPVGHSLPQFSQISQQLLTLHRLFFCHLEKCQRSVSS